MIAVIRKKISIPIRGDEKVSAILTIPKAYPPEKGTAIILAHGAGNDMEHRLLGVFSQTLAEAGFLALRFNFLYREKGKKSPDSQKTLVATWQKVFEFLNEHPRYRPARIIAAGKSMGGRVASQMVAEGSLPVQGLIFLGYPLHPPGKMEKTKDAHLYDIKVPMLFFAGTRDPLCNLQALSNVLDKLNAPWDIDIVDGGNHSFALSKKEDVRMVNVYDSMVIKALTWLKEIFHE